MIPLIDDFLQKFMVTKLRYLKANPSMIGMIFQTGQRESLSKLTQFITTQKIRVVIGYPRDQSSLPAYVITLAPEQEQPSGLGDNVLTYGPTLGMGEEPEDIAQEYLDDFVASTMMNANYRIECWSDNGDLTAYMYVILKWCLWSSRKEMLALGWNNIRLDGTDLEPVPDYMPIFVYRRSVSLALTYDALYHEDVNSIARFLDVVAHPDLYDRSEDGSVIQKETGSVIIPAKYTWIINQFVETVGTGEISIAQSTYTFTGRAGLKGYPVISVLPEQGVPDILYLVHEYLKGDYDYYKPCIWDDNHGQYIPLASMKHNENSYKDIIIVNPVPSKEE
jgi:hypothetical protein